MNSLPDFISQNNMRHYWTYLDSEGRLIAIVVRYDESGKKKRYHQFSLSENGVWVEGAPTPLPLFGIDTLPLIYSNEVVYIFEGEKCTQAAHYLGLPALTSMMGSSQGHLADWSILS